MINRRLDVTTLAEMVRDLLDERGLLEANDAEPFGFEISVEKDDEVKLEFNGVNHTALGSPVLVAATDGLMQCSADLAKRGYTVSLIASPRTLVLYAWADR